jgi:hypothetical protein
MNDRRDRLYAILERLYARIERGQRASGDTTALEDRWLRLLRAFDEACD